MIMRKKHAQGIQVSFKRFKKSWNRTERERLAVARKIADKIFEAVCSCANRSRNKSTFIMTPLVGLFLTCGGEKYTVILQYCTIYNDLSM
jgi:hypothetical protein